MAWWWLRERPVFVVAQNQLTGFPTVVPHHQATSCRLYDCSFHVIRICTTSTASAGPTAGLLHFVSRSTFTSVSLASSCSNAARSRSDVIARI